MAGNAIRFWAAGVIATCIAIPLLSRSRVAESHPAGSDLTVHEWGTFTSVAGRDGQAIEWLPLTGSTDLPEFVEHLHSAGFKCGLGGTVRMETPVLYFYSSREITASVKVSFAKGWITEWYPHATSVEPAGPGSHANVDGSIHWDNVHLLPGSQSDFPSRPDDNHYYAARNTSATPVRVKGPGGDQDEKFLFYRGLSETQMPIAARLTPQGQVLVRNLATEAIPSVMLLDSRGGKLGYRVASGLRDPRLLDPPPLTATNDGMLRDLEGILIAQGLYVDEARAMIATWRNSWFEEGTRLLYALPQPAVNAILPLTISPAPANIVRVFVGRLEIVTPATETAVEQAFAAHDHQTLDKYRRFLEPVLKAMLENSKADPVRTRALKDDLNSVYDYACRWPWPTD